MVTVARLKSAKRAVINAHTRPDNRKAITQVVTTLAPMAMLWWAAAWLAGRSVWLTAGAALLIGLFVLRAFVLMHECGHRSLFRGVRLNAAFGFTFGVLTGMPQYVWSRRHDFHHATNGDWEKYRGALNTFSVAEYEALTEGQRRSYRRSRSIWLAPVAGFVYLIFNPRFTWLKGNIGLLGHLIAAKRSRPGSSIRELAAGYKSGQWESWEAWRHMSWNNLAVLSLWALMSWAVGPLLFFPVYVLSVSLAGAGGLVLFTVQHNFNHSYASATRGWDYDAAALHGTSFLILPRWLNWMTANIGYHHVHHLSARIPNYCLVRCHDDHQALFTDVTRIRLAEVPGALRNILWDTDARRIISLAEWDSAKARAAAP